MEAYLEGMQKLVWEIFSREMMLLGFQSAAEIDLDADMIDILGFEETWFWELAQDAIDQYNLPEYVDWANDSVSSILEKKNTLREWAKVISRIRS
jgi:hypothetical protein